ncbi:MAG TPA: chemotaxis protein CheW [Cyanobacteria bacterium UBA8803]|nr:chemotaxis protein CheW [Cyanobacteria bacterium UBA9273]HBL58483.1 chemotaxis protein CheW [Cyanobacteria bacterium UBA8803]
MPNSSLSPLETPAVSSQSSLRASEQFLRFHLLPDTTALLPIEQLTEVLTIPRGQIVPIFQMPAWVIGAYNWRGEVLWMVDLGHLVGLTPWHQEAVSASTYTALVLQASANSATSVSAKNQMLGLVVNRVEDIEWCNPDLIQSPPSSSVTPELVPFLRGYWLKSNGEMLVLLDGKAIIAAMPKP